MQIIEWIQKEAATNQFFSAAVGGSLFYSVFGYLRSTSGYFWRKFVNLFIREITVSSYYSADIYNQLVDFLSKRISHPKNIEIKANYNTNSELDDDYQSAKELKTSISYGAHWFWYNWYTYVYAVIRTEEHHASTKSDVVNIHIYSLFSRTIRKEISELFINSYVESSNSSKCYELTEYGSSLIGPNLRKLDSVFIDKAIKDAINNSINSLTEKAETYAKAGINRTIGIMLYGPPGTGKTSYICGLAKSLNRSVYYVDFTKNVEGKAKYLKWIKPNSFLVLEDIDTVPSFRVRDDNSTEQKDLGKLLKILDGAQLPDNTVIFATTNYIDKIDPAVKRFGRFDLHFEFQYADKELATEMVDYIDSSKLHLLDELTFPVSQAEIQARVLKSSIGVKYVPTEIPEVLETETQEEDKEELLNVVTVGKIDNRLKQLVINKRIKRRLSRKRFLRR